LGSSGCFFARSIPSRISRCASAHLTQRYDRVKNYTDLPDITIKQIEHFFEHYKDLEPGKWVKILRWGDAAEAQRLILEGIERAKKQPDEPKNL